MGTPPPDDQFQALVRLLYFASVEARAEAWQGENESDGALKDRFGKIARLMDAIHNIPGFLTDYDNWDQPYFELCLGGRDSEVGKQLHGAYQNALSEARSKNKDDDPSQRPD
ncbi:hypothetical protein N9A86_04755 [Akkermansiaceae bacterium]|nr:hypothetical protein [Akkermansiaceae bacterium]